MTWVLQAAVVLSVLMGLLGAVWAIVLGYRYARKCRQAAAEAALGIYGQRELELTGFRGWLADWVDGTSSASCASSSDASPSMCGDTTDAAHASSD
ncbi:hypothetical protein [Myxococcus faecalis]|uniref:hypothetical protein n=1 Tax=Myxococcus faecalis TaxID=3115646 RepID=UPI003CF7B15A